MKYDEKLGITILNIVKIIETIVHNRAQCKIKNIISGKCLKKRREREKEIEIFWK